MGKGWVKVGALLVAFAAVVYVLIPGTPPGEWRKIDETESELYFAGDDPGIEAADHWRTGWFRDEQSHRVLGWSEGLQYPRYAIYLQRRPHGAVYMDVPAPGDLIVQHYLFDAGYEALGQEQLHSGRIVARYLRVRVPDRECLLLVGAESGDVPDGELANLNGYLSGYYCTGPGGGLDDETVRLVLDSIGTKASGDPVPAVARRRAGSPAG